ncbi:PIG-M mannosyltransferase [Cryptosporidium canis]|nr:PIG-M mannosyltransferase [Cryptosporidium canis]
MWSERTIGKAFRYVVEHVYLSTTCLHLLVLFYGLLQDRFNLSVKFTDIDYMVFTDAAKAVLQGKSPYTRHTYRYTPLLAYITSINIIFKMEILSKLLFCAVNILSGKILEWLLILLDVDNDTKIKGSVTLRRFLISTWLLNPFPLQQQDEHYHLGILLWTIRPLQAISSNIWLSIHLLHQPKLPQEGQTSIQVYNKSPSQGIYNA